MGTQGLIHTNHDTMYIGKLLKPHWSLIWLRGSVSKARLHVNYRDTFLKSNEEKVGSKPKVNIIFFLFYMWFVLVFYFFLCFLGII